jgi:hypothetical protein
MEANGMRAAVRKAITDAYIHAHRYKDLEYRLVDETTITSIQKMIEMKCDANVSVQIDTNYSTSYDLDITHKSDPTPDALNERGWRRRRVKFPYYRFTVRISWLGPFAAAFWNKYLKPGEPQFLWRAEEKKEQDLENCVYEILSDSEINVLDPDELKEEIGEVNVPLLDGTPSVLHLLFAQYM